MTGTLRGRERQSKMTGFWTQGMRKWVPSPTTSSCTPRNRSNITARCPASTAENKMVNLSRAVNIIRKHLTRTSCFLNQWLFSEALNDSHGWFGTGFPSDVFSDTTLCTYPGYNWLKKRLAYDPLRLHELKCWIWILVQVYNEVWSKGCKVCKSNTIKYKLFILRLRAWTHYSSILIYNSDKSTVLWTFTCWCMFSIWNKYQIDTS